MQFIKDILRNTMNMLRPGFEERHWDRQEFRAKGRKPPDLMWSPRRQGHCVRQDAAGVQIGHLWYVIAGFFSPSVVISTIDVYDFDKNCWVKSIPIPDDMPQTHLGIALEADRWVYCIGGQLGNQCSPPVGSLHIFDTQTDTFTKGIDLPEKRYAPVVELWQGRLHAIGGSLHDRFTPSAAHYSIAVKDGKVLEDQWQKHDDAPRGGPHRGSAIVKDKFYLFGGQIGDYTRDPNDPECRCIEPKEVEIIYPDVYCLNDPSQRWERKADMAVPASHMEFSTIVFDDKVVFVGGMEDKDPNTRIIKLTDAVQVYNASTNTWKIVGQLPFRVKSTLVAYYKGYLYIATGQRDISADNPAPFKYISSVWRANFDLPKLLTIK